MKVVNMLSLPLIFSIVTAAISAAFAFFVLRRWVGARRAGRSRPHLLAWGIGLILYLLGSFSQIVLSLQWSAFFFALWYWSGALAVAPWLGQGTIYLLVRRGSIARNIQMALLLICIMTLPWALFLTPLNGAAWEPGIDMVSITNDVMQRGGVRGFVPVMNIWGTIALVGGAIYSSVLFRRKQILRSRMIGNWLIAAGGLMPALGGALIRLDLTWIKYPAEMVGIILIFVGFLVATHAPEDDARSRRDDRTA
ncbi:MAG: hypothetical protein JNL42_05960 [Anaerolineae bacterium]|nr:hypothetical protein [Anaerolineae bacterium]